jgi:hypothetical protein
VRVRLTEAEHAAWTAAREKSGRRELGAWVRAVVSEVLTGTRAPRRPGDLPFRRVPEVNVDVYRQLVAVASNVNQLARWCNTEQRAADARELHRLADELETLAWQVRGSRRPPVPAGDTGQPGPGFGDVLEETPADAATAAVVPGRRGWLRRAPR